MIWQNFTQGSIDGAQSALAREPDFPAEDATVRAFRSFAAICIVFGAVALVALPFGLTGLHQGNFAGDLRVPMVDSTLFHTSWNALWMFAASSMGAALGAMLLVGGIGALNFRAWARPLLICWAWSSVGVAAVGCIFYLQWLFSPWRDLFAQVRGVDDSLANFGGWGIGLPLAIVMLILLNRPSVRALFNMPKYPAV